MKFIYHAGTGTIIDSDDDVYVIDLADMTPTERRSFIEGDDDSVLEEIIDAGRATRFPDIFGDKS